jgi:hypothetical protein
MYNVVWVPNCWLAHSAAAHCQPCVQQLCSPRRGLNRKGRHLACLRGWLGNHVVVWAARHTNVVSGIWPLISPIVPSLNVDLITITAAKSLLSGWGGGGVGTVALGLTEPLSDSLHARLSTQHSLECYSLWFCLNLSAISAKLCVVMCSDRGGQIKIQSLLLV